MRRVCLPYRCWRQQRGAASLAARGSMGFAASTTPCCCLQAVRDSSGAAPSVTVNIDTLTFDRVLIFLEAYALKRRPPRFAVHLLADLLAVCFCVCVTYV